MLIKKFKKQISTDETFKWQLMFFFLHAIVFVLINISKRNIMVPNSLILLEWKLLKVAMNTANLQIIKYINKELFQLFNVCMVLCVMFTYMYNYVCVLR